MRYTQPHEPPTDREPHMPDVKPIPDGYTAVTPYLIVADAAGFLDFLANAFRAAERMRVPMPQGGIGHAEVEIE